MSHAGNNAKRMRWFCSLCGAMTTRAPDDGPFARCAAHAHLPTGAALTPADPLTMLPTMAAELHGEDTPPAIGTGA